MPVVITPVIAAILTFLFIALSARVILMRGGSKILIGDGGDRTIQRRMRVHSNFAEYVPLALVLLLLLELQGVAPWLLWALGGMLVGGRVIHAYGVSQEPEPTRLRIAGMALTFTALAGSALGCLWLAVAG